MPFFFSTWLFQPLFLPSILSDGYAWGRAGPAIGDSGTVVEKSFSNQKVASSIPFRSVLEQDTEPLIAPDVQCAISVNVKCVYILVSRFG